MRELLVASSAGAARGRAARAIFGRTALAAVALGGLSVARGHDQARREAVQQVRQLRHLLRQ